MVSRRRFVGAAAATFVAAGVPALFAPAASAAGGKYSAAWWRKRLGAQVEFQGRQWHLGRILEVREISSSAEVEQFTISFQGSANDRIAEGIYTLTVDGRPVRLFVQPSGGDDASNYYTASVAQLLKRRAPRLPSQAARTRSSTR